MGRPRRSRIAVFVVLFLLFVSLRIDDLRSSVADPVTSGGWLVVGALLGVAIAIGFATAARLADRLHLSRRVRRLAGWSLVVGIAIASPSVLQGVGGTMLVFGWFLSIPLLYGYSRSGRPSPN